MVRPSTMGTSTQCTTDMGLEVAERWKFQKISTGLNLSTVMHNGQPHGCVSKMFWVIVVVYGMARIGKMGAKLRALVVVLCYMQSKPWNMVTRERLVTD